MSRKLFAKSWAKQLFEGVGELRNFTEACSDRAPEPRNRLEAHNTRHAAMLVARKPATVCPSGLIQKHGSEVVTGRGDGSGGWVLVSCGVRRLLHAG